jgi:hypothetical protein
MNGPSGPISAAPVGHCSTHKPHRSHNDRSISGNAHVSIIKTAFLYYATSVAERETFVYDKSRMPIAHLHVLSIYSAHPPAGSKITTRKTQLSFSAE